MGRGKEAIILQMRTAYCNNCKKDTPYLDGYHYFKCSKCYEPVRPKTYQWAINIAIVALIATLIILFAGFGSATFIVTPSTSNPTNGSTYNTKIINLGWNITTNETLSTIIINSNSTNYTLYSNDLILYYNFDNRSILGEGGSVVKDISSNANDATNVNATKLSSIARRGNAYYYNNTIGVWNITNKNIVNATDLTICTWFNMVGKGGGAFGRILDNTKLLLSYTDNMRIQVSWNATQLLDTGDSAFSFNTWNHVCVARNSTGYTYIYINGVLKNSGLAGRPNNTDQTNLYIGGRPALDRNFNGTIDELQIWKKQLNSNEINQLYKSYLTKTNLTNYDISFNTTITNISYNKIEIITNDGKENYINSFYVRFLGVLTSSYTSALSTVKSGFYGFQTYSFDLYSQGNVSSDDSCVTNDVPSYTANRLKLISSKGNKIRYDLRLDLANQDGTFDRLSATEVVEWAYQNNVTVVLLIHVLPEWLVNKTLGYCTSADWSSCPPYNYDLYGNVTLAIVKNVTNNGRYNSSVEVEIGNEMYGSAWLNNLTTDHPTKATEYVKLYNASYTKLKAVFPSMRVGGGSTYQLGGVNMTRTFLSNLTNRWDFIALHQYTYSYPYATVGKAQYGIENATAWLKKECTTYSANCADVYLSEFNLLTDDQTVFTQQHSETLSHTFSYLLNNYGNNYSIGLYRFGSQYKNFSCSVFSNYTSYNQFTQAEYPGYKAIYRYARYAPSTATVYSSSTSYQNIDVVSTKIGNTESIIITNNENDAQNITLNVTGIDTLIDIDTYRIYDTSEGTATIVVEPYEDVYLTEPIITESEGNRIYDNYFGELIYSVTIDASEYMCREPNRAFFQLIIDLTGVAIIVFVFYYGLKDGIDDWDDIDYKKIIMLGVVVIVAIILLQASADNLGLGACG